MVVGLLALAFGLLAPLFTRLMLATPPAFIAALAGLAMLRVLEARTANGVTLWTWIALGVLVVSMVGPLGASGSAAVAGLAVLHLLVGAVVIVGLRRRHAGRVA